MNHIGFFRVFNQCDWKQLNYGDVEEAIPPNASLTRGKDVDL
jgi:hypothetical protein